MKIISQISVKILKYAIIVPLFFIIADKAYSQVNKGYVEINDLNMYYEIHGTGEPMILLHGGLGSTGMFEEVIPELAKNKQVIAVDLQGHGRTADINRPIRLEFMADDIAGLIRYLKLESVDIVGYSLGGGVGLHTAIQYPGLVKCLVVISAPFSRNGYFPEILNSQAQVNASIADVFKATPIYQNYVSVAPNPGNFPLLLDKMGELMSHDFDFSEDIRKLELPVMLVFADADMFPTSHISDFFGLLGGGKQDGGWDGSGRANSQLAILPGFTHYNIFMSPLLVPTINSFLDKPMAGEARGGELIRVFNAPVEKVWKAWSDPEYVKKWWGPVGFTAPVAEIDFREGGKSLVAMASPDHGTFYSTWTYQKIEPMKRIEFVHHFSDKEGNRLDPAAANLPMPEGIPDEVPHVVTFKSLGKNKTELSVEEYGYTTDQAAELSKMGMEQCLDKMVELFRKLKETEKK